MFGLALNAGEGDGGCGKGTQRRPLVWRRPKRAELSRPSADGDSGEGVRLPVVPRSTMRAVGM